MTFSDIKDRGMTEAQGRSVVARSDRQSWYPGTQAHHAFAILSRRDSREVCRAGRRDDRDQILALARAHDAMREALEDLLPKSWMKDDTMDHMPGVKKAREALALAKGVK